MIAVQNQWDEAAYSAMVDPQRQVTLSEQRTELATYRALHGTSSSFAPVEVFSPKTGRFKLECDRGTLELDVGVSPRDGLITGFLGSSRGITAPAGLRKQAEAIASLLGTWDDGLHQRLLAKTKRARAEARAYFDDLGASHGACRLKVPVHVGFEWRMELGCDRGGGLTLHLVLHDRDPAALEDYSLSATETGCPRR